MIDIRLIRENPELVKENIKKKFQNEKIKLVDDILKLDEKWRKIKYDEDSIRSSRNKVSKEISEAKKKKDEKKAKELMKKAKEIPEEIAKLEEKRKELEEEIQTLMYKIPNVLHESVPIGKDDSQNVEIKRFPSSIPKKPEYEIFNHAELAERLKILDLDSSRTTSGQGFYFLKGDLAQIHSALMTFARDYMIENSFEYVIPPFMIRKEVVEGVMSFTEMDAMMYKIEHEDLYLIGTSEHAMIGLFKDKMLLKKQLPFCLTSYSPCFRKEKGAHGIEEKGLYRVHQFEKQEMIVVCSPEDSWKWFDKMLNLTIEFFKKLEIPIRTLESCSGDLADLKAKGIDVEAWSPRQNKYFEVGSCSNLTDAQARRLNIRIDAGTEKYFAHTLNNTVIASPRVLIALMENHQQKDGTIRIPKVLQPYMQGKKFIGKN